MALKLPKSESDPEFKGDIKARGKANPAEVVNGNFATPDELENASHPVPAQDRLFHGTSGNTPDADQCGDEGEEILFIPCIVRHVEKNAPLGNPGLRCAPHAPHQDCAPAKLRVWRRGFIRAREMPKSRMICEAVAGFATWI